MPNKPKSLSSKEDSLNPQQLDILLPQLHMGTDALLQKHRDDS